MTWTWSGMRVPLIKAVRFWQRGRRPRIPMLDPRLLNAHWRRDLGLDN